MFTEEQLENDVIEYFKSLGMTFFHASELGRNEKEVLLFDRLEAALVRLNPGLPMDVSVQNRDCR